MNLELYNCPKPAEIGSFSLPEKPAFANYKPNFDLVKLYEEKYSAFKNLLIVGHGGSITSFYGIYHAFSEQSKKEAYFLSTVDPDYIFSLKKRLDPKDTLVIAISKSGETVTQIEALAQFLDYPLLLIAGSGSPLAKIGEKLGAEIVPHPPIGGRYTGLTEVALLPAGICGFDIQALFEGAAELYALYERENLAFRAASVFWELEQVGYVDVFMPFYSHGLFPLSALIVQLCHESFGKEGRGQTYFAHEAPESQHHTNQRFFGGTKNIAGFFISSKGFLHQPAAGFPPALHSVELKGRALFDLGKTPLSEAMHSELLGTLEDARINGIPVAHLAIPILTPKNFGLLMSFWQLYAVYSSAIRMVDPFNQPQVENSKIISFNKRLKNTGLS